MVTRGRKAGLAGGVPFHTKAPAGKSREGQLLRLPGLQLQAQSVSVQMQDTRRITGDTPAQPVSLVNLDQALVWRESAIDDAQGPRQLTIGLGLRQNRRISKELLCDLAKIGARPDQA